MRYLIFLNILFFFEIVKSKVFPDISGCFCEGVIITGKISTDDSLKIDGKQVPPFHFGLVMEWEQWHEFKNHLEQLNVQFRIKPHTRYPGKIGEQATMFIDDPSGNSLAFKSFSDDERLFATVEGNENEVGGGKMNQQNNQ